MNHAISGHVRTADYRTAAGNIALTSEPHPVDSPKCVRWSSACRHEGTLLTRLMSLTWRRCYCSVMMPRFVLRPEAPKMLRFLACWFALSLPFGVLCGRALRGRGGDA